MEDGNDETKKKCIFILYYHQRLLFLPKGNQYTRRPHEERDANKYRVGRFLKEEINKETNEPIIREMTYSEAVKNIYVNIKNRIQARAKENLEAESGDDDDSVGQSSSNS